MKDIFLNNIKKKTLILMIIVTIFSFIIFQDVNISIGIILGCFIRLAGFNSIIKMTNRIEAYNNPKSKANFNYIIRMLMYCVVIYIAISEGINLIALAIGMFILNIVIIIESLKGGERRGN